MQEKRVSLCQIFGEESGMVNIYHRVFLFSAVNSIPRIPHIHIHFNTTFIRWTRGQTWERSKTAYQESNRDKSTSKPIFMKLQQTTALRRDFIYQI
jgi:hypothetical protein